MPGPIKRFYASFQFRLFLIFTLLTALLTSFFCVLYITSEISQYHTFYHVQIRQQALRLAEVVRLPLYSENRVLLQQLAEEEGRAPHIRSVIISSIDGRVLAGVRSPADQPTATQLIRETVEVRSNIANTPVESILSSKPASETVLIGSIVLERSTEDMSDTIRVLVIQAIGIACFFWLAVSMLSYQVLRRVTRSFSALMHGIDAMKEGDYTSQIAVIADDEPARAARAVNDLAAALKRREEENNRLIEERIDFERHMLNSQKLESLGVMAGGIAHDFNNLLQGTLGNLELAMIQLGPDSAAQKFLANAIESTYRAADLSGLMLTYIGKSFIAKEPLNLNTLIRDNVALLNTAATSSVSLDLNLAEEMPAIIAGKTQIQQVIMNLVTNAAESIEVQPGFVSVATGVQEYDHAALADSLLDSKPAAGRFVYLEVRDNGCGISKENLARIFDPFFTTKFTGRGLGMSAVMGIIKTHGGALFVESEPGRGTTFRVLFPAAEFTLPETVQETASPSGKAAAVPVAPTFTGKVLVVDDEKIVLKICTKMVELCGFTVITAVDGSDAVTTFSEHADEIVLVLMDLTMPNMDGITAMNEIYAIRPDALIILSSGFNKEELSERITSEHPPAGFIRKPYSMEILRKELQRVVSTGREPDGRSLQGVSG